MGRSGDREAGDDREGRPDPGVGQGTVAVGVEGCGGPDVDQPAQGVIGWDVAVTNQRGELCASYEILTLVAKRVAG